MASLFEKHGRLVLGLCRFLLRDSHEADDAAQQTFLSAYRSLLAGTDPRDPASWLAEIARNECRARIVKRMREPLPITDEVESTFPDPADTAGERELLDELKAAIAQLPDRQREAVILRDFYGLSYREVAAALEVSVPVVESLLFRARREVKRHVGTVPRLAHGALLVPLALRDELARAIPGFDTAAAGLGVAGGAGAGGLVAKLASLPLTAKIATATTAVAIGVGAGVTPQIVDRSPSPPEPAPSVTSSRSPSGSELSPAGGAARVPAELEGVPGALDDDGLDERESSGLEPAELEETAEAQESDDEGTGSRGPGEEDDALEGRSGSSGPSDSEEPEVEQESSGPTTPTPTARSSKQPASVVDPLDAFDEPASADAHDSESNDGPDE